MIDNLPMWAEIVSTPNNKIVYMEKWDEKLAVIENTINEDVTDLAGSIMDVNSFKQYF